MVIGMICFAQNTDIQGSNLQGEWICVSIESENETIDPRTIGIIMLWKFEGINFSQSYNENGKTELVTGTFKTISNVIIFEFGQEALMWPYTIQGNTFVVSVHDGGHTYIFHKH